MNTTMNIVRPFLPALLALAVTCPALAEKPDEQALLKVLVSDASVQEQARACQQLAVVGGPKSVPALASLLGNEQLAAYARSGLETIDDPSAGVALRKALAGLKGRQQAGVATSLGVRRDQEAVPALAKLASDPNSLSADSALTSLGQIASADAIKASPSHTTVTIKTAFKRPFTSPGSRSIGTPMVMRSRP